jgi:hypothetical protein
MEGVLQAPALIIWGVSERLATDGTYEFAWSGKGRPHPAVEPGFWAVFPRTSVYIWHSLRGRFTMVGGRLNVTVELEDSEFPSDRVYVDGGVVAESPQHELSDLWVPDTRDGTMVH